jgi:ABC-type phosphate transport system substrate-binding protein
MRAKHKLPGLLAIGMAGALALSGVVGSSSAMATTCSNTSAIVGQGSSLQAIAQNTWASGSLCKVTYNSTSSGSGQNAWHANGTGSSVPSTSGDTYIGTDEPLDQSQLEEVDKAADGKYLTAGEEQTVVIPVVQAAVAVIDKAPANCEISEITNADLQKVWNGTILEWSGISTAKAAAGHPTACNVAITRVVRSDKSGTTYVYKEYLNKINSGALTCVTIGKKNWEELAEPVNNLTWPESCTGTTLSKVVKAKNSGGGGEVEEVIAQEGSIGYANLGDARKGYKAGVRWLEVENGSGTAWPGTGASEPQETAAKANCSGTSYGTQAELETLTGAPAGVDDNWSLVSGLNTKATTYPICTLTYDVALVNYELAGYGAGTKTTIGEATKQYLEYVTTSGQSAVASGLDYDELPSAVKNIAEAEAKLVN